MPSYDSDGNVYDNSNRIVGQRNSVGAWAGSGPGWEEEELRKRALQAQLSRELEMGANQSLLADQQVQAGRQKLTSDWEASRAQSMRPYDSMPMERMALDEGSPLFQNSGNPQIQMDIEPIAGAWAGSAPPRFDTPDTQRVPQGPSVWDAAFSKTNLGRWNQQELSDTPESRMQRARLEAITGALKAEMGALNPNQAVVQGLRDQLNTLTGVSGAPSPNPATVKLAGVVPPPAAAEKKLRVKMEDGQVVEMTQAQLDQMLAQRRGK